MQLCALDKPFSYRRNKLEEVSDRVEVYDLQTNSSTVRIDLVLVNDSHYELLVIQDGYVYSINSVSVRSDGHSLRIVATAMDIIIDVLKTRQMPILICGDSPHKLESYKKVIWSDLAATTFTRVKDVKGVDGWTYPMGFFATLEKKPFKIHNIIGKLRKTHAAINI